MRILSYLLAFFLLSPAAVLSQLKDSVVFIDGNYIGLSEIVINQKLDVSSFIKRVKDDTSFYKAFKNLRIVGFTSVNDIRMLDRKGKLRASLNGKTRQIVKGHCRSMDILNQSVTGDFFDENGGYNYYTASMYAQLFFTNGVVCNENNIVGNREISTEGLRGIDKHKAQLKMLFFNPGRRISGLPFISNKTEIFGKEMAKNYDMKIDYDDNMAEPAYIFTVKVKTGKENNVVIKEMKTWFSVRDYEILARNYSLSYDTGVYDFDVDMKVRMTRFGDLLIPSVITYNGNWKIMFKKREKGIFTATISDFETGI